MADTTETGLKNVTDELNLSNALLVEIGTALGDIDDTLANPPGPSKSEIKESRQDAKNAANKNNSWLAKIAGGIGMGGGGKTGKTGKDAAGKGLKGMLMTLLPAGMLAKLGGAGIIAKLGIGGIILAGALSAVVAVGDGLKGMDWAKSMGMEKESGFIAGFFGGNVKGGLMNAFKQSMKGAAMGATIGMAGGPVGMIVGALIGAALFGIAGWFGAGALAKMIDPLVQDARKLFGLTVNVTPKELEDAKKVAATTLKLKTDAISNTEKLVEQLTAARAATEPDQKLIDSLVIQVAASMKASVVAHKNHEKAATKSLLLDRAAERNAVVIAEDAVKANNAEIMHLQQQKQRFKTALQMYGEDSIKGQIAAAQLAAISVKLKKTREDGKKLRDDEEKAEALLLKEDRRLIQKAKDEGGTAPWRARLNVMTADAFKWVRVKWNRLTTWAPTWFANNIFDPGSGPVGIGDSGSPMRIFGIAIPSLASIKKGILEKWSKLKTSAISWFTNNIFDSGTPMKIFGVAMPSMKEIKDGIQEKWNTLKASVGTWFADNIFKLGPSGARLSGAKIFGVAMPSMEAVKKKLKLKLQAFRSDNIIAWFTDNIFDPGSGPVGIGDSGSPMRIFGVAIPSMEEITKGIQEKWSNFKTSAISWFANNIFDPGSADGSTPMKIFGFSLKLPVLKIPTGADILAILPDWMTDPIGALKKLIKAISKFLPSWLGGPKSEGDLKQEAAIKTEQAGRANVAEGVKSGKISEAERQAINRVLLAKQQHTMFGGNQSFADWLLKDKDLGAAGKIRGAYGGPLKSPEDQKKFVETNLALLKKAQGKAMGGPVTAGRPYLIGERGPELMVPKQSGTITPNHALGGGATVINAPTTSNVTTTGNSGQFPLQNNKYANLNRAYA